MDSTDGRLAPVTYLPGIVPPHSEPPSVLPSYESFFGRDDSEAPDSIDDADDDLESSKQESLDENRDRAERISLSALTRRGQSQRELERTLRSRGIDDVVVTEEVERLTRVGLIDDPALAQTLVATLQERKGLGRSAIAAELTRRLLSPAAIEYALELVDSGDELARAKELALKRARQLGSLDRDAAVRRLSGYLARRGYGGSTIRSAVEHALPSRPTSTVRFR